MYITEQKPMHIIADELGVAIGSVYKYCKLYGIESRKTADVNRGRKLTKEQCEAMSKRFKGLKRSDETKRKISQARIQGGIGHKKKRGDGYISIYFPSHPQSTKDGYIMEHDLVMECLIGRHLMDDEVVHHINHQRDDNRVENLKLMTKSEHASFHNKERHEKRRNDLSIE